ncbi:hypothetical protein SDC9_149967 [bioreactor metagenome]|uniref:Uncharacterized protein n=1 Tax=bioreactor metagenome TaxID=1076179 RepID=A0A645EL81_9ZZZZ
MPFCYTVVQASVTNRFSRLPLHSPNDPRTTFGLVLAARSSDGRNPNSLYPFRMAFVMQEAHSPILSRPSCATHTKREAPAENCGGFEQLVLLRLCVCLPEAMEVAVRIGCDNLRSAEREHRFGCAARLEAFALAAVFGL